MSASRVSRMRRFFFVAVGLTVMLAHPAVAVPGDTIADRVLGKQNFTTTGCEVTAAGLCTPLDAIADSSSGRLYVVDENADRILGWPNATAFRDGDPADLLIGQPDFDTRGCNTGGLSAGTLCKPSGVAVDSSGNLYVGDWGNNRVLGYDNPETSDGVADRVWGQSNFTSNKCRGATATSTCGPRNTALDAAGNLYVSDNNNNRILIFLNARTGDTRADFAIGQPGFTTGGCRGGAAGLCEPRGLSLDSSGNLYVADTRHHRILLFRQPMITDERADRVFGQRTLSTAVCNRGGVSERGLCGPRDVDLDVFGTLWIVDTRNNRVLGYLNPGLDTHADVVLGQPGFTTAICNNGGVTASSMCEPRGITVNSAGDVFLPDSGNGRLLRYDRPV